MSYLRRAFLYVTRKKVKSLLLFLILLVIATLALSGVAIRDATKTAQLNVRQALGGVFTLRQNTADPQKWVSTNVGQYGSSAYYGGAPLTVELAEYIRDHIGGILGYNATYTGYTVPVHADGTVFDLLESDDDGSGMSGLLAGYGDFSSTVSTYASTNTAYDGYFYGGYLELTEGRHFTAEEHNAAIISQALAERNGLAVGDQMTLRMSSFKANMIGYDAGKTCTTVTIVGLFRATSKSTASLSNWSMDNSVFTTLDVLRTARPDMGAESYEKISFYVSDPGELDSIVERVKQLPDLDPTDFTVDADSSAAQAVMRPLANMDRLITVLIVLVLTVGAGILCLILSVRIRERVHESGVLLSLGLSRWNIAAQYLTEVLLIAVFAFSLSLFTSGFVAQTVGNQLLEDTLSGSSQADPAARPGISGDGVMISGSGDYAPRFEGNRNLTQIEVSVAPGAAAAMWGIGFLLICGAVFIAAMPVLKRKPREIVSIMS